MDKEIEEFLNWCNSDEPYIEDAKTKIEVTAYGEYVTYANGERIYYGSIDTH